MKDKKLPTLLLKKIEHRKGIQLMVVFDFNNRIKDCLKFKLGYFYSKTHRGWYTLYNEKAVEKLKTVFKNTVQYVYDSTLSSENKVSKALVYPTLTKEQNIILKLFKVYLERKKYSENNIKKNVLFINELFSYVQHKPIAEISNKDLKLIIEDAIFLQNNNAISQFVGSLKIFKEFYPECIFNEDCLT